LVLGGVRSGKSRFAQELAQRVGGGDVLFVATAEARDGEMAERVAHHRKSRPSGWRTLEQPREIAAALNQQPKLPTVVLVDCLTLLVSNILCASPSHDIDRLIHGIETEIDALIQAVDDNTTHLIVVSGEVGQGIVPEHAMGRVFRDLLGWANQRLAKQATTTYWMIAGLAIDATHLQTSTEQAAEKLLAAQVLHVRES